MGIYRKYDRLVANVVTTLEIPVRGASRVELLLRTEARGDDFTPIYFTYGESLDRCPDPVIEGDCEYVGCGKGGKWPTPLNATTLYIKMISAGTPKYALRVW